MMGAYQIRQAAIAIANDDLGKIVHRPYYIKHISSNAICVMGPYVNRSSFDDSIGAPESICSITVDSVFINFYYHRSVATGSEYNRGGFHGSYELADPNWPLRICELVNEAMDRYDNLREIARDELVTHKLLGMPIC